MSITVCVHGYETRSDQDISRFEHKISGLIADIKARRECIEQDDQALANHRQLASMNEKNDCSSLGVPEVAQSAIHIGMKVIEGINKFLPIPTIPDVASVAYDFFCPPAQYEAPQYVLLHQAYEIAHDVVTHENLHDISIQTEHISNEARYYVNANVTMPTDIMLHLAKQHILLAKLAASTIGGVPLWTTNAGFGLTYIENYIRTHEEQGNEICADLGKSVRSIEIDELIFAYEAMKQDFNKYYEEETGIRTTQINHWVCFQALAVPWTYNEFRAYFTTRDKELECPRSVQYGVRQGCPSDNTMRGRSRQRTQECKDDFFNDLENDIFNANVTAIYDGLLELQSTL